MNRRSRWTGTGVALVLAIGLGLMAGLVPGHHDEQPLGFDATNLAAAAASTPGDRMQAAIDGVQETGLYVGPELRGELTDDDVAAIEEILAEAPVPVFVVWWADTRDAGYGTPYGALDQLRAGVGRDGFYAVVTEGSSVLTEAVGYETPYVSADGKGRPAPALERFATELAGVPPVREQVSGSGSDYWGGIGGGIAAGLTFATLGYVGLMLVLAVVALAVPRRTRSEGRP